MKYLNKFDLPDLGSSLTKFLHEPLDNKVKHEIKMEVMLTLGRLFREKLEDQYSIADIDISVEQDKQDYSKLNIIPNNLYTLMILNGEYVPCFLLNGDEITFETDEYIYNFFTCGESKIYEKENS